MQLTCLTRTFAESVSALASLTEMIRLGMDHVGSHAFARADNDRTIP